MTNENTEPQDTQPAEATESAPEPVEDTQPAEDTKAGKEAARYRRQLRKVEAERDALAEKVTALQRAEVERHAAHLTRPDAIWAAGLELADVLDEDGNVDPERVTTAITDAADRLGLARAPGTPAPDPTQGAHGTPARANAFTQALRVR